MLPRYIKRNISEVMMKKYHVFSYYCLCFSAANISNGKHWYIGFAFTCTGLEGTQWFGQYLNTGMVFLLHQSVVLTQLLLSFFFFFLFILLLLLLLLLLIFFFFFYIKSPMFFTPTGLSVHRLLYHLWYSQRGWNCRLRLHSGVSLGIRMYRLLLYFAYQSEASDAY